MTVIANFGRFGILFISKYLEGETRTLVLDEGIYVKGIGDTYWSEIKYTDVTTIETLNTRVEALESQLEIIQSQLSTIDIPSVAATWPG
jgi:hypothetical protein